MLNIQGFSAGLRQEINQALTLIRRRLSKPPGPIPRDLLDDLRAILGKPRPRVDLVYGSATGGCPLRSLRPLR